MAFEGDTSSVSSTGKEHRKALQTIRETAITLLVVGALAGVGFLAYVGANINRESVKQSLTMDWSGQKAEYLARPPRKDLLRLLPWNDDDGHAIIRFYGADGTLKSVGFDENYDGNLLSAQDRLDIMLGDGKRDQCFIDKAITESGSEITLIKKPDGLEGIMKEAAVGYCRDEMNSASNAYEAALQQVSGRK